MPESFKDPICITKFRGAFTLFDAALIPDQYLANSLNVSCADFSITPFSMYSQFANQLTGDDNVGRIISSFTLKRSDDIEVLVRLRDNDSTCTLEWYNSVDNTWETLLASLTIATPIWCVDFNTATQDYTVICNGVMNFSLWKKAIGTIASNTATVITLNESSAATQGFSSGGGTVIIDGIEYAYTGISGATITGLAALPTFAANTGVAEAVDDSTYTTLPKFIGAGVADGRLWCFIKNSVRLYYSQVGVCTNFTSSTNPDDPGSRDFIEGGGRITGLGFIKENAIVHKPDLVTMYKLDYPSSASRVSITKAIRRGDSCGAVNQEGIVTVGEQIFHTTTKGGIKSISLSKLTDEFDFNDETEIVRPSLKDGAFISARAVYWEKEKRLIVSYKNNSDSTYNDRCVVIEFTKEGDTAMKTIGFLDWQVGSWFKYANNLYFGGSYEPNCFKAFDGYQKGTADAPFTALFTTKRYRFSENPILQKDISYIALDGWILHNKLKIQISYNYLGSLSLLEYEFDPLTDTGFIVQPDINTIGAFEMGSEPIGGLLNEIDDLNYFRFFISLPHSVKPTDIQATIWSTEVGSRWRINSLSFLVKDAGLSIPNKLKLGVS